MTNHQQAVIQDIRRERKTRMAQRRHQHGDHFVDTIYVNRDQHGEGRVGFTCEFSGKRTYCSGQTLQGFARNVFGSGVLRKIEGGHYAVMRVD
jgi:hypothetical protein